MIRNFFLPILLGSLLLSCSPGKPPEDLFQENIHKMVRVDRAMGFEEEVTGISVVKTTSYQDQVEAEVRVEGWATQKDLALGATLPVSKTRKQGWAVWKFFCRKQDKTWEIVDKYKVEEGFE